MSTKIHVKFNDVDRFKVKYLKKIYHVNTNQKKGRMVILISDKVDFSTNTLPETKEGH